MATAGGTTSGDGTMAFRSELRKSMTACRVLPAWTLGRALVQAAAVTDSGNGLASVATAGGTLVLAIATFASTRSANRSARIADRVARTAERSLLARQRHYSDRPAGGPEAECPVHGRETADGVRRRGHAGSQRRHDLSGLRGPRPRHPARLYYTGGMCRTASPTSRLAHRSRSSPARSREIYLPPGDIGFWQGASPRSGGRSLQDVATAIENHRTSDGRIVLCRQFRRRTDGRQPVGATIQRREDG